MKKVIQFYKLLLLFFLFQMSNIYLNAENGPQTCFIAAVVLTCLHHSIWFHGLFTVNDYYSQFNHRAVLWLAMILPLLHLARV